MTTGRRRSTTPGRPWRSTQGSGSTRNTSQRTVSARRRADCKKVSKGAIIWAPSPGFGRDGGDVRRLRYPDEVRKKIEPAWEVADSLTLVPPAYGLSPDKLMRYVGGIASALLVAPSRGATMAAMALRFLERELRRLLVDHGHDDLADDAVGAVGFTDDGGTIYVHLLPGRVGLTERRDVPSYSPGGLRPGALRAFVLLPLAHKRGASEPSR
jgi:hypothetical protein